MDPGQVIFRNNILLKPYSISGSDNCRYLNAMTNIPVFAVLFLLGFATTCEAYIDPTAGSFLFQMLAPIGALIASFVIYFRNYIFGFFRKRKREAEVEKADSSVRHEEP
jgi:ABC-type uncharacterized transport system permease subunit